MNELSKKDKTKEEIKTINNRYRNRRIKDMKKILNFKNIVDYKISDFLNYDYYNNISDFTNKDEISYDFYTEQVSTDIVDVYYNNYSETVEKRDYFTNKYSCFNFDKLSSFVIDNQHYDVFSYRVEDNEYDDGYERYSHTDSYISNITLNLDALLSHYYVFLNHEIVQSFIDKIFRDAPHAKEIINEEFIYSHNCILIPKKYLKLIQYYDRKKDEYVRCFSFSHKFDSIEEIESYLNLSNILEKEELNRKLAGIKIASRLKELGKISAIQYDTMLDCTLYKVGALVESLKTGSVDYCTIHSNTCKNSYCPICERNKAKKKALKVQNFLTENYKDNYYFFLTLTVPNIHYKDFKTTKILYKKTWDDFVKRVLNKNDHFNGYLSTYEITFEDKREDYIHPHSHILLSFSRKDQKGKFKKAKQIFNVEKEIENLRNKWTKYFLSKLKKYHLKKGDIYGIKCLYNSNLMFDYIDYQKNFSVDVKTIKEDNFESVAFELSHYMFKPSKVNKEDISASVNDIVSVFEYKIKMYDQVKNMNFTNRGGVFKSLDLEGPDQEHYLVLTKIDTKFENNNFKTSVENLENFKIVGTRKQLSKNKLFNHVVNEAKRFANQLDLLARKNEFEEQIRAIQSKIELNNQILLDNSALDYNIKHLINQRIADLERDKNEIIYNLFLLKKVHND